MPRNKYNARKVTIDDIEFDSKAEARRYGELKLLESAGEIRELVVHPRFELLCAEDWNGKHYRPVSFTPDFQYFEVSSGKTVVEDVKGGKATQTRDFKLRLRLWILNHPEEDLWDFRVVEM
jgi:hypothetical protein